MQRPGQLLGRRKSSPAIGPQRSKSLMQGRTWGFRSPAARQLERRLVPRVGGGLPLAYPLMGQLRRAPLNPVNPSLSSLSSFHNVTVSCSRFSSYILSAFLIALPGWGDDGSPAHCVLPSRQATSCSDFIPDDARNTGHWFQNCGHKMRYSFHHGMFYFHLEMMPTANGYEENFIVINASYSSWWPLKIYKRQLRHSFTRGFEQSIQEAVNAVIISLTLDSSARVCEWPYRTGEKARQLYFFGGKYRVHHKEDESSFFSSGNLFLRALFGEKQKIRLKTLVFHCNPVNMISRNLLILDMCSKNLCIFQEKIYAFQVQLVETNKLKLNGREDMKQTTFRHVNKLTLTEIILKMSLTTGMAGAQMS